MHNWLIFQYHRVRAKPEAGDAGAVLRDEPTHAVEVSNEGTQEGK